MGFRIEETVWIALPDGTRLAATLWLPEGAGPFPAVLEYLPYRRRDQTAERDDATYPGLADAGIVGVRVDSRGQGDSEGLFDDEYSETELTDAEAVIAWIAAQPWSNGRVGMMGISWGGFNALQVAARRPPALKAVISIASTTDRFADDIHYKGGAMLSANLYWAGVMLSFSARPPDPEVVGPDWRAIWQRRLEALPFLAERWMRHRTRDAYWRHGSIAEDWGAIEIPVWVIAGWADGYRNTPFEMMRRARGPVWAMTGPWVHKYPHFAVPGPRADFVGLAGAWWHHWLGTGGRGIQHWPRHAAYRLEGVQAGGPRERDPGEWVDMGRAETTETVLTLGADGRFGGPPGPVTIASPQDLGTAGGAFFPVSAGPDIAGDQAPDDARAVCWESAVLDAPLDLGGRAVLEVPVAVPGTRGTLVARLVDVAPDGRAALIARGVLDLRFRGGMAAMQPMVPGQSEPVRLTLDAMAWRVRAGHRLRLALSTAYWPMLLPEPGAGVAEIGAGPGARLILPVIEAPPCTVPEPGPAPVPAYRQSAPGSETIAHAHDPARGRTEWTLRAESPMKIHPRHALHYRDGHIETWEIPPDDPSGATGHLTFWAERGRRTWQTRTDVTMTVTLGPGAVEIRATLIAHEADTPVATRQWNFTTPRDAV